MKNYYVYILASKANGTLYIGVTNSLERRNIEHISGTPGSFTQKYNVKRLVYFEATSDVEAAIRREKQLKNWHRQWKINLIESMNPMWQDLSMKYRMGAETSSA
ncbi:MAG TPA: GIY-YIG nuclease family protein [Candidatus Saccharimonadales bacterium]|nr:GIY-YIG nuclease family protein [Candidatus Saccharimonadales bacterium]